MGAKLPTLPAARKQLLLDLGLSDYEATTLTEARERADYYDAVRRAVGGDEARAAKRAANWVLGEALRWCNVNGREIDACPVTPGALAELIEMVEGATVTGQVAKGVFEKMAATGEPAGKLVRDGGLAQISEAGELSETVKRVLAANEKAVADFRAGKEASLKFLMGQVMRETRGRANPQTAQAMISQELA